MIIQNFLEKALTEVNLGKNIKLEVSEDSDTLLTARIFENKIVWSESNFVDMYFLIHEYIEKRGLFLAHNIKTYYIISKCCLAHEVGHLIDKNAKRTLRKRNRIAKRFNNKPSEKLLSRYNDLSLKMENRAWDKIEKKLNIRDEVEKKVFYLVKEFGLNSYGNKKEAC